MSPRPRLVFVLVVLFAATTLLWFPYQSSNYHSVSHTTEITEPWSEDDLPETVAAPSPPPPPSTPIVNNNVTFPRLNPGTLSPTQARILIDRIQRVKSTIFQPADHPVGQQNHWHLDRLLEYLHKAESHGTYPPPMVVMTSWHWMPCTYGPCTTGEVQWIRPLIEIMKEQGIFFLFSPYETFRKEFAMLGNDLVSHVWVDDEHLLWCYQDKKGCIQSEENPGGIQLWKMFAFTFWGSKPNMLKWSSPNRPWSFNPLGPEWNLVPYQMPDNQFFLGYHYQGCQSLPYIPHDQRKNQIVILAKLSNYFHKWPAYDPNTFYVQLKEALGEDYELLSNADEEPEFPIPDGVKSLGLLPPADYDRQLSGAKALLGIGKPIISPTPYASLCRGVPVIIPYRSKHYEKTCVARPNSKTEYCGFDEDVHQHGPAAELGEPYVYAVDVAGPMDKVIETIKRAVQTPIKPFEPEEMTKEAVQARLLDYFAIDWKTYGESKLTGPIELPEFLSVWLSKNPDKVSV